MKKLLILVLFLLGCSKNSMVASYESGRNEEYNQMVLNGIKIREKDIIADVGAGGGYFTILFSEQVGKDGLVYAVDMDPEMLKYIEERKNKKKLSNIRLVQSNLEDPKIPQKVDKIFLSNVYHHLGSKPGVSPDPDVVTRVQYLKKLHSSLKDNGKFIILERCEPSKWHGTEKKIILVEMQKAGFLLSDNRGVLPAQYQCFFIFDKEKIEKK